MAARPSPACPGRPRHRRVERRRFGWRRRCRRPPASPRCPRHPGWPFAAPLHQQRAASSRAGVFQARTCTTGSSAVCCLPMLAATGNHGQAAGCTTCTRGLVSRASTTGQALETWTSSTTCGLLCPLARRLRPDEAGLGVRQPQQVPGAAPPALPILGHLRQRRGCLTGSRCSCMHRMLET